MASWAHEMGILWAFLVLLVLEGPAPALGQLEFICPGGKDGLYAHPTQCDRFFQCVNKKVKRRLCPDGLVFDKSRSEEDDPCNNIHNTKDKCRKRPSLQRPQPGDANCPRQNGVYPSPDITECDKYYSCLEGKGSLQQCAEGLHFEPELGVCVWARESTREGCLSVNQRHKKKKKGNRQRQPEQEKKKGESLPNGFECPGGPPGVHPALPHPTSDRLYYVCLNGVTPQEAGCKPGLVFNEVTARCDKQDRVRNIPRPGKSQNVRQQSSNAQTNQNPVNRFLELLQDPTVQASGLLNPDILAALGERDPVALSQAVPSRRTDHVQNNRGHPRGHRNRAQLLDQRNIDPAANRRGHPQPLNKANKQTGQLVTSPAAPPPEGTPLAHRRIPPQRNNRFTQKFLPRVKPVGNIENLALTTGPEDNLVPQAKLLPNSPISPDFLPETPKGGLVGRPVNVRLGPSPGIPSSPKEMTQLKISPTSFPQEVIFEPVAQPKAIGSPLVHRTIPPERHNKFTSKFLPKIKPVGNIENLALTTGPEELKAQSKAPGLEITEVPAVTHATPVAPTPLTSEFLLLKNTGPTESMAGIPGPRLAPLIQAQPVTESPERFAQAQTEAPTPQTIPTQKQRHGGRRISLPRRRNQQVNEVRTKSSAPQRVPETKSTRTRTRTRGRGRTSVQEPKPVQMTEAKPAPRTRVGSRTRARITQAPKPVPKVESEPILGPTLAPQGKNEPIFGPSPRPQPRAEPILTAEELAAIQNPYRNAGQPATRIRANVPRARPIEAQPQILPTAKPQQSPARAQKPRTQVRRRPTWGPNNDLTQKRFNQQRPQQSKPSMTQLIEASPELKGILEDKEFRTFLKERRRGNAGRGNQEQQNNSESPVVMVPEMAGPARDQELKRVRSRPPSRQRGRTSSGQQSNIQTDTIPHRLVPYLEPFISRRTLASHPARSRQTVPEQIQS